MVVSVMRTSKAPVHISAQFASASNSCGRNRFPLVLKQALGNGHEIRTNTALTPSTSNRLLANGSQFPWRNPVWSRKTTRVFVVVHCLPSGNEFQTFRIGSVGSLNKDGAGCCRERNYWMEYRRLCGGGKSARVVTLLLADRALLPRQDSGAGENMVL
jgi:hypothetical protein